MGETTSTVVQATDIQGVIAALQAQINVTTIVGVIAAVIGACIGIAFLYWAIRKVIRAMMSALKRGKVSV